MLIHLLSLLKKTKKLKEFLLVVFMDANSCVLNRDFEKLLVVKFEDLHHYFHTAFSCELERVGLQREEDLHYSLLIALNDWAEHPPV